jgi:hypothetical protein
VAGNEVNPTSLIHGSIQVTFDLYAELMEEAHEDAAKKTENWIFEKINKKEEPLLEAVL